MSIYVSYPKIYYQDAGERNSREFFSAFVIFGDLKFYN